MNVCFVAGKRYDGTILRRFVVKVTIRMYRKWKIKIGGGYGQRSV